MVPVRFFETCLFGIRRLDDSCLVCRLASVSYLYVVESTRGGLPEPRAADIWATITAVLTAQCFSVAGKVKRDITN